MKNFFDGDYVSLMGLTPNTKNSQWLIWLEKDFTNEELEGVYDFIINFFPTEQKLVWEVLYATRNIELAKDVAYKMSEFYKSL